MLVGFVVAVLNVVALVLIGNVRSNKSLVIGAMICYADYLWRNHQKKLTHESA